MKAETYQAPSVGPGTEVGAADRPGTDRAVTADPIWFGPDARPLFGWFHRPTSGRARYGVVLCPPVGDEDRRVYSTFRMLAESLAGMGHAVLRFSYDGTGDSTGSFDDPDRVAAWTRSISDAVGVVRAAGVPAVAVIGMRLGATLATRAADAMERPLDALVLWDPCVTGREFLRHQKILLTTIPGNPSTTIEGTETPGYHFSPALTEELQQLTIAPVTSPETRTLVLARPDRPAPDRLHRGLGSSSFEQLDATGQDGLLDVPPLSAVIPWESIHRITAWLTDGAPRPGPISSPEGIEAIVGTDADWPADTGAGRPARRDRALRHHHDAGGWGVRPVDDVRERRHRAPHRSRTALGGSGSRLGPLRDPIGPLRPERRRGQPGPSGSAGERHLRSRMARRPPGVGLRGVAGRSLRHRLHRSVLGRVQRARKLGWPSGRGGRTCSIPPSRQRA